MTTIPVAPPGATNLPFDEWRRLLSSIDGISPAHEEYSLALLRFFVPHLPEATRPLGEDLLGLLAEHVDDWATPSRNLTMTAHRVAADHPDDEHLVRVVVPAARMQLKEATSAAADLVGLRPVLEFVMEEVLDNPRSLPSNGFAVERLMSGADRYRTLRVARQYKLACLAPYPPTPAFLSALDVCVEDPEADGTSLRTALEVAHRWGMSGPVEEVYYCLVLDGVFPTRAAELAPGLV